MASEESAARSPDRAGGGEELLRPPSGPPPLDRSRAVADRIEPTGWLAVYVHFPFCLRRCPYCDFAVVVTSRVPHATYSDAVLREIEARVPARRDRRLGSLYFGGGTPGLWAPDSLARVVEVLRSHFAAPPRETTVELNPEEASPRRLEALRAAGVDRLSFGLQSFDADTLRFLGRAHDPDIAIAAVEGAAGAGFSRISVDLIYGIPGRAPDRLEHDLRLVGSMPVDHVSAYELTIEPKTALARRARAGVFTPCDQATLVSCSVRVDEVLGAHGFSRYEISNYARPGGRSLHNMSYWVGDEYLGLGLGAHSLEIDAAAGVAIRTANPRAPAPYLGLARSPSPSVERLTPSLHLRELIMLGCRTTDGVDLGALARRFGDRVGSAVDLFDRWAALGWGERQGERFRPSALGLRFADSMGAEALAF